MFVNVDSKENVTVIQFSGRMDASNSEEYKEKLLYLVRENQKFILDLEKLDSIDSSGLGVLVKMLQSSLDKQGDVIVINLNYKTRLVFEITRANKLFGIFNSLDQAMKAVA